MVSDEQYLLMALALAEKGRGVCAPNPAVGAVLVKNGKVIAEGYHQGCGLPHAEVEALREVDRQTASESVLYVTLEPCCHTGRTPPCTDLIIKKGVKRVVYAFQDPNPKVAGKGAEVLHAAGIACAHQTIAEIDAFYQSYQHWLTTGRPWMSAKIAVSLDGKIAGPGGQPMQITGEALGRHTHEMRRRADAMLTTSRTVIADDPQMNVRLGGLVFAKPLYVMDRALKTPLSAQIFKTAASVVMLYGKGADPARLAAFEAASVRCVKIEADDYEDYLSEVIAVLGAEGLHEVWVEAGAMCFNALLDADLLQRAFLYVGVKHLGEEGLHFSSESYEDVLMHAPHVRWAHYDQDMLCEMRWDTVAEVI